MLFDTSPFCLDRLHNLGAIDLGKNRFYGLIGKLYTGFKLRILVLRQNSISGHLPDFDCYSSFFVLDLSCNSLQGPIPKLPRALFLLLLSNNNLTGEIPLSFCEISASAFDLSNNSLTGSIPPCLLMLNRSYVINLGMNKLEGAIPDTFTKNTSIRALDLNGNQLTGPFPRSMANCKMLMLLDLSNNDIQDSFPNWLETLPVLQVLVLKSNRFNGKLKTVIDHPFPNLRVFDISNNNLTGHLPIEYISQLDAMKNAKNIDMSLYLDELYLVEYFQGFMSIIGLEWYRFDVPKITLTMKGSRFEFHKLLMALSLIDFSNNNFQGEVPEVIGELVALKGLNLSHNNFIGSIPLSIQNLTSLEWLDLSSNNLSGVIPSGLAHLMELSSLNLSYNELRGMIPRGQQLDTFGMESFAGNTRLCGLQVGKACGEHISNQTQLPLPSIKEDDFCAFDWKIILIGYGCGLVIGISIGYMVLELRRPEWFMSLIEERLLKMILKPSRWRT